MSKINCEFTMRVAIVALVIISAAACGRFMHNSVANIYNRTIIFQQPMPLPLGTRPSIHRSSSRGMFGSCCIRDKTLESHNESRSAIKRRSPTATSEPADKQGSWFMAGLKAPEVTSTLTLPLSCWATMTSTSSSLIGLRDHKPSTTLQLPIASLALEPCSLHKSTLCNNTDISFTIRPQ